MWHSRQLAETFADALPAAGFSSADSFETATETIANTQNKKQKNARRKTGEVLAEKGRGIG